MKFWILFTLICTANISIAATCSATENSSTNSLSNLIAFANDSLAATDELDTTFKLSDIDIKRICFKTDLAKNAEKNPYEVFKVELEKALKKRQVTFNNIEVYISKNLSKIQCSTRDTIKVRNSSSIFKHAINSKNYALVEEAILIRVNGKTVCNPNIDFMQSELIDGKKETLINFIDNVLSDNELNGIYHFESIENIRSMIYSCNN